MTLENTGFFDQLYLGFVFRVRRENRQGVPWCLGHSGAGEQALGAKSGFKLPYCRRMGLSSSPGEGQLEFPAGR